MIFVIHFRLPKNAPPSPPPPPPTTIAAIAVMHSCTVAERHARTYTCLHVSSQRHSSFQASCPDILSARHPSVDLGRWRLRRHPRRRPLAAERHLLAAAASGLPALGRSRFSPLAVQKCSAGRAWIVARKRVVSATIARRKNVCRRRLGHQTSRELLCAHTARDSMGCAGSVAERLAWIAAVKRRIGAITVSRKDIRIARAGLGRNSSGRLCAVSARINTRYAGIVAIRKLGSPHHRGGKTGRNRTASAGSAQPATGGGAGGWANEARHSFSR